MLFNRKKKAEPERSKFVEAPKVFVSLGRTVNLGNFNSMKFDAGFSGTVGDTLTLMSEGATAVQQNETVVAAYKRAFMAVTQELDDQARYYGVVSMKEWFDAINPNKSKQQVSPASLPPAAKTIEKPASQKAVAAAPAQSGQLPPPKKTSIAERLAAETDKLKERGKEK